MAGHSKWNNIKGRKGAQDEKRGKIFQKLSREIYMAAKSGDPDPDLNPALRLALDKAKSNNMPNDNIQRAIKRATQAGEGEHYEETMYEGYGPDGVAVLVHALTDNFNRTSTNVRIAFTRNGGTLGEKGSVNYMFDRKGYIAISREDLDVDEDTMLMSVLEYGGEDLETSEDVFEIYTDTSDFTGVRDGLISEGYELDTAEITMVPQTSIPLSEEHVETFQTMLDKLDDDDDVTDVFHNAEFDEE